MPVATAPRQPDAGLSRGLARRPKQPREQPEHAAWARLRAGLDNGALLPPPAPRRRVDPGSPLTIEALVTSSPYAMRFTAEQWARAGEACPGARLLPEPTRDPLSGYDTTRKVFDPFPAPGRRVRAGSVL
jgi:hypothetical protein